MNRMHHTRPSEKKHLIRDYIFYHPILANWQANERYVVIGPLVNEISYSEILVKASYFITYGAFNTRKGIKRLKMNIICWNEYFFDCRTWCGRALKAKDQVNDQSFWKIWIIWCLCSRYILLYNIMILRLSVINIPFLYWSDYTFETKYEMYTSSSLQTKK